MSRNTLIASALAAGVALTLASTGPAAAATVIELTQTPCQFLEPEGGTDHGYRSAKKADCEAINEASGAARLAATEPMTLKPGKYIFRVTNKNVPYGLGFWLRGDGIVARATLPSVSGGGLTTGATKDYEVELTPGSYVFSCPLNPTPDYRLVVAE
ncbi:MAG: hypothetical protein JSU82_12235 [Rhodospirillales bacterium]|nr:MAG: hypothetical protein JSU82_12235 [Rhodospirillales bacterium]